MTCPEGTSQKVLLNASCHKKYENIWFMYRDLSSFQDTKPFYEVKGVGACVCTPWGLPDQYYWILCVMSYMIIYGLGVEI